MTGRRTTGCSRTRRTDAFVPCSVPLREGRTAPSRALAGPVRWSRVSVASGRTTVAAAAPRPTILSWRRLLSCLGGGLLAAGVTVVAGVPEISVLVGWSVAAGGLLIWVWRISWPRDSEGTKRLAEEEGRTHVPDAGVLGAAEATLAPAVVALAPSGTTGAVGGLTA